jgi:hypothetical protein
VNRLRRGLFLLFVFLLALIAAPPIAVAEPGPGYELHKVYWGTTELGQRIIDYRIENPTVSGKSNVASFKLVRPDGTVEYYAAASVGTLPKDKAIGMVAKWVVEGGKLKYVGTFPVPNMGNKHSEQVVRAYLSDEDAALVTEGESELKPCQKVTNNCRLNLQQQWFTNLRDMNYNIPYYDILASYTAANGKLKPSTNNEEAIEILDRLIKQWIADGRPRTGHRYANELFTTPGSPPAAPDGLVGALTGQAGAQNGGIDFSSLQLRYLTDAPPGSDQGIRFSFSATASNQPPKLDAGRAVTLQASDAFFVWLSLSPSTFWVNLNPTEPDRIVDAKLGTTDVGRILLQADLQMKKTVARLIHPDTATGKQFWAALQSGADQQTCLSMRQWIVPGPATVREDGNSLYILDTPLTVLMENDYVKGADDQYSCQASEAVKAHNEQVYRTSILPKVQQAVNTAPEYADLRRVYLSRVAAEWYRKRNVNRNTAYADLINSGDVRAWPARLSWSPRQVFDQYVESYKKGEFNVTRKTREGNYIVTHTYVYGGVDFGKVRYTGLDPASFSSKYGPLPDTVAQSLQRPSTDEHGVVWYGSVAAPRPVALPDETAGSRAGSLTPAGLVTIGGVSCAVVLVVGTVVVVLVLANRRPVRQVVPVGRPIPSGPWPLGPPNMGGQPRFGPGPGPRPGPGPGGSWPPVRSSGPPPSGPILGPPVGPSTGPIPGPPTGPIPAPPLGPPTGPISAPPFGTPTGPVSGSPTGPFSEPSTGSVSRPSTRPTSGPPVHPPPLRPPVPPPD